MQLNQIDIQQGRIKHFLYKSRIRSALYGGQVDNAFFSTEEPMAKWISITGMPKYGTYPEMRMIQRTHNELHTYATELISLYRKGKIQEAKDGLPEVERYSEQILAYLEVLEGKV